MQSLRKLTPSADNAVSCEISGAIEPPSHVLLNLIQSASFVEGASSKA